LLPNKALQRTRLLALRLQSTLSPRAGSLSLGR
jgi:hypothetical protein